MAREVLTNKEGLATGVSYVNKEDMQEYQVMGRIVILGASTCESARLLLNSKSPRHPNGLANSSDMVGRNLSGHSGSAVRIYVEELQGLPPTNQDGATDHAFIPRYNHLSGRRDYAGGWDIQVNF